MKKLLLSFTLLLAAMLLTDFGYRNVRGSLLHAGMSWTISEWSYYFLLVLFGLIAGWLFMGVFSGLGIWKRRTVGLLLTLLPFAIGFAQHPIYEDMVWNGARNMSDVQAIPDYADADLVVIAIADCPFCKRAISEMKAMRERNPKMRMRMVVCTADSTWLEPYVQEASGSLDVTMATDMNVVATHAGGHFPAYVKVVDGKPICRWSNNEWGPLAKDEVEK
jgi:hypothetical protein